MGKKQARGSRRNRPKGVGGANRILCDFSARSEREQEIFTQTTWCDSCFYGNLGMLEPVEFILDGKRYLEGKCFRCGSVVISEIVKSDISGVEEDIIWPIHHNSWPARTYLPRKSFGTFVFGGNSKYSFSRLRTPRKISKTSRCVFLIIVLIFVSICIVISLNDLKFGH